MVTFYVLIILQVTYFVCIALVSFCYDLRKLGGPRRRVLYIFRQITYVIYLLSTRHRNRKLNESDSEKTKKKPQFAELLNDLPLLVFVIIF